MSNLTSNNVKQTLLALRSNPGKIQQYMLNLLDRLNNGQVGLIDATNPAIFVLESSAVLSSTVMTDNETKLRRQYPSMASTMDELYLHMADTDYYGVFATPAVVDLTLLFDYDEIKQKAVDEGGVGGTRKLTIPAYTKVLVADTPLTLLYPIDIRVMSHGGFNISFDTKEQSPIARVENNLLEWFVDTIDGVDFLNIVAPFHQLSVNRYNVNTNAITSFKREYAFENQYCFCRAWHQNQFGEWVELKTTYTDLVYNKDVPTVIIKVLNKKISVNIPQIYFNTGLIKDTIRIDIYTTKGAMDVSLANYSPKSFTHDWSPLEGNKMTQFSSPLSTLSITGVYSSNSITGGSNPMTFTELKNNVTNRSAVYNGLPISEKQLIRNVRDMGYSIVKNIDNITDRQYLATRALPIPNDEFIVTNMGVTVATLETNINKLRELDTVSTSTYRLTIKPQTLYKMVDGIIQVIPSNETKTMVLQASQDPTFLVDKLNKSNYVYSPYYYVFDLKNGEIGARVYDLDSPIIKSRYFFQDNDDIEVSLGVKDYAISIADTKDGYWLDVTLDIGQTIKQHGQDIINVQLSYIGRDEPTRYYIEGSLISTLDVNTGKPIGDIYVYRFKIETKYDVDSKDGLIPIPFISPINLTHEFDVITILKDYDPNIIINPTDIDNLISKETLPNYDSNRRYIGVSHNKVVIKFGDRLKHIWHKTRTIVDTSLFAVHDIDVPKTYTEDVYEKDEDGHIKFIYDKVNNNLKTNKLHSKGDLMYDHTGEQLWLHRKGDPVLDVDGNPVFADGGDGLVRQIDLFLIDGAYYFANTINTVNYRKSSIALLTQWISNDMVTLTNQLLDRTEVFYYPPSNIGRVSVIADEMKDVTVDAKQRLKVNCYLTEIDLKNSQLRESLTRSIVKTIQSVLQRKTVSRDAILQALRMQVGDVVISFELHGFLKDRYRAVTLVDNTNGLTLGTRLNVLSDFSIDIENDIDVEFMAHIEI